MTGLDGPAADFRPPRIFMPVKECPAGVSRDERCLTRPMVGEGDGIPGTAWRHFNLWAPTSLAVGLPMEGMWTWVGISGAL
jgi:hypothetical protein